MIRIRKMHQQGTNRFGNGNVVLSCKNLNSLLLFKKITGLERMR